MTENDFTKKLDEIVEDARSKIVALVEITREEETSDGFLGNEPVSWSDYPNWERRADNLIELGGWIYDRMNGRTRLDQKSVTKKLRKALGYTYP